MSRAELVDFITARLEMEDTPLQYWCQELFHVALPIVVSMVGLKHTALGDYNYGVNDTDKLGFWFMCFVLAALLTEAMGVGRSHSFVLEVWRMTMKDFMVPCAERDNRSGGRKRVCVHTIYTHFTPFLYIFHQIYMFHIEYSHRSIHLSYHIVIFNTTPLPPLSSPPRPHPATERQSEVTSDLGRKFRVRGITRCRIA